MFENKTLDNYPSQKFILRLYAKRLTVKLTVTDSKLTIYL